MQNLTYIVLLIGGLLLAASPASAQTPAPGTVFRDCADVCPEMVAIPPGSFTMGTPASESGHKASEEPQHLVTIGYSFAVGKFDVTRDEFAAFVNVTGYKAEGDGCFDTIGTNWQSPGMDQTGSDPVVCISLGDAQAYMVWLSQKTGHAYRLLSESEWEYAARAGTTTAYWWGDAVGVGNANCGDCGSKWDNRQTSPSGLFQPNPFGLYDMNGNVWQWTADCYNFQYNGAPNDGSAWASGDCDNRVLRGGSWDVPAKEVRAAARFIARAAAGRIPSGFDRYQSDIGFRVARTF